MRKPPSRRVRSIVEVESVKQQVTLDDYAIRELLRRAYSDFEENIPESQAAPQSEEALFLPFLYRNENEYTGPTHLRNNPNISLFWKLFIQRHIISFEQDSLFFMNWHRNQVW